MAGKTFPSETRLWQQQWERKPAICKQTLGTDESVKQPPSCYLFIAVRQIDQR